MNNRFRAFALCIFGSALAIGLAACGGGGGSTPSATPTVAPSAPQVIQNAAASPPPGTTLSSASFTGTTNAGAGGLFTEAPHVFTFNVPNAPSTSAHPVNVTLTASVSQTDAAKWYGYDQLNVLVFPCSGASPFSNTTPQAYWNASTWRSRGQAIYIGAEGTPVILQDSGTATFYGPANLSSGQYCAQFQMSSGNSSYAGAGASINYSASFIITQP